MKIEDAANVLNLSGELTTLIIKKAYRVACKKYHPDRGGSVEMMQAVNQAYNALKDFEGVINSGSESFDYGDILNTALLKIVGLEGLDIEVCGAWIWVTGDTKTHKQALGKEGAGFFWANKKKAWYFRPSDWKSSSRGAWSLDRIRDEHGSQKIKGKKINRLAS